MVRMVRTVRLRNKLAQDKSNVRIKKAVTILFLPGVLRSYSCS